MRLKWLLLLLPLTPVAVAGFQFWDYMLRGPLGGMVVVIDPGHGGSDPGSHGVFGSGNDKVTIREDEYVFDVACRLKARVESLGGTAVLTTIDPVHGCTLDERAPNEAIPAEGSELFALDAMPVAAGEAGLQKRTMFGNAILARYWWRRVVFISIHFDAIGVEELAGVHFIAPEDGSRDVIDDLVVSFTKAGRIQKKHDEEYQPVKYSGDRTSGMRRIYVLSQKTNEIRQRVLIELGNFTNPVDVWRIRDPAVRTDYARLIAGALMELNTLPPWEVRNE